VVERKRSVVDAAIEGGDGGRGSVASSLVGGFLRRGLEGL
jgi:hypothetical protein